LLKRNGSAWGTTQANAWATLGLASYAAAQNLTGTSATLASGDAPALKLENLAAAREFKLDKPAVLTNDGQSNLFYSVVSHGIPQQVKSTGNWQIRRAYLDLDGKPVTTVKQGDLVQVRLLISAASTCDNILLCDLLPGGLEIEDARLATRTAILPQNAMQETGALAPVAIEKRDDRFLLFGNLTTATKDGVFTYLTRAVSRGTFTVPPFLAEAMYSPEDHGIFATEQTLTVE
jgi:hypothetical protein